MGRVAAAISVISIPILFITIKQMFNAKVAVLAALFYTFSYLTVIYNRTWWPLTFSPIISLLSYLLIYKIVVTRKLKLVIPLGVVMVVAVQTDPSNFSTLLLIVILW